MTHPVLRAAFLAFLAGAPLSAAAQPVFVDPPTGAAPRDSQPLTGIRASVARDLRAYGFRGVDVRDLTVNQIASIHQLAHSRRSYGDIRLRISTTLRGGLLQRWLDSVAR